MSSCALYQIPSGDFAQALHTSDWKSDSFPISASFDLTSACNLRCRHCFLDHTQNTHTQKSTTECEHALDILVAPTS